MLPHIQDQRNRVARPTHDPRKFVPEARLTRKRVEPSVSPATDSQTGDRADPIPDLDLFTRRDGRGAQRDHAGESQIQSRDIAGGLRCTFRGSQAAHVRIHPDRLGERRG